MMRRRAGLPALSETMIGESETTGRSPSDHVLLLLCSFAEPAVSPGAPEGLVVSTCICTLPSAMESLCSRAVTTNSHPSAKSAGSRTSITDGACTQRSAASTGAPLVGCLPKSAGSSPMSPVAGASRRLLLRRRGPRSGPCSEVIWRKSTASGASAGRFSGPVRSKCCNCSERA